MVEGQYSSRITMISPKRVVWAALGAAMGIGLADV
jgi:hypothetical protein